MHPLEHAQSISENSSSSNSAIVPDIALPSTEGELISPASFAGKNAVVLFFYPADDTPGCTREVCAFRDDYEKFRSAGTVLLGVSTDSIQSHFRFKEKYKLPFTLLSDVDAVLSRSLGVYDEIERECRRSTILIGRDGAVLRVFPSVKIEEHSQELLTILEST